MKTLAVLVLVGVFIRHGSANWIHDLTNFPVRGAFYILGGLWESLLCAIVALLVWNRPKDGWWALLVMGCLVGIVEGLMMVIGRLMVTPSGPNLFDTLTGLQVGATAMSLYAMVICYWHNNMKKTVLLVPVIASAEVSYLVNPIAGIALFSTCYALWGWNGRES
jgi:hypothetical protein